VASPAEIRRVIEALVRKQDQRRDGFAKAIQQAMQTTLGSDAEEVQKVLNQKGIARSLAKEAIAAAREKGRFTIFAVVDALTRIAGQMVNAGERTAGDQKAAGLLALAV
jgi:predicted GNAT family acetyltransferase